MTRWRSWVGSGLILAALMAPGTSFGEEPPLLVTYGKAAPTKEGDEDHREILFFSLPAGSTEPLYLRLFDPDVGGAHDSIYGAADGTTRFALFGGAGAFSRAGPSVPAEEALGAGRLIAERTYGAEPETDERWQTLSAFTAGQGERIGERAYFRLVVQALTGNDGNVYALAVSRRDRRNAPPDGLRLFAYAPTVRMPDRASLVELRFRAPEDRRPITIENFDAANGELALATRFRDLPLTASSQDVWQASERALREDERGETAAIVFRGGDEIPNDATFRVLDAEGQPLPLELPPRRFAPNRRPLPVADLAPLADCGSVAFDAGNSSDADGDALRYSWRFGDGDGSGGEGPSLVHRYPPGRYLATLQVTDSSGQVGQGAERELEVWVREPPRARAGGDLVVAEGEPVRFDGSASTAGDRAIARYLWEFGDGGTGDGVAPVHVFARSGRYLVTLRVEDDAAHACNAASDELEVVVNAAPVAVAGSDRVVAVGEPVALDGGRSYDRDGRIARHGWRFGDGAEAAGAAVEHRYDRPGSYRVELAVDDDAGVANSRATDSLRVTVNAPPVAAAGADRRAAAGEVVTFDGGASEDADGRIVTYDWDLGDGRRAWGASVSYAYPQPGRYRVALTVRDDSGTVSSSDTDTLEVEVNAPPVAVAGDDQLVTASLVRFDGTGSRDPDGAIASYRWDFGDGGTASGPAPEHVYQQPGRYQVKLTVADDSGTIRNSASDRLQVVVNAAPIADAGPDVVVAPGEEVTFAGTRSIDPDGDLAGFDWDFRDGARASGPVVSHSFAAPGIYQVRLRVADATGHPAAVAHDDVRVVVNAAPVAEAGHDTVAAPGDAVPLDGRGSFDLDGRIASYRWDFSDDHPPLEGAEVARRYERPGVYQARLTVIDDSGTANGTAQAETAVRINTRPQAVAGSDVHADSSTLTFDGSASTDPDGDPLTYRWSFGDGSPPAAGARVSHRFAEPGTYPVVLEVDDGTGVNNSSAAATVTAVIDRPPVADAGGSREVCAGDVVVFDGSRSRDPDGGLLRYHWDFGDGSTDDTVNPTKVYKAGKAYPVTLTVQDESGLPGGVHSDRIAVRVKESPIASAGPDQTVCAGSEVHFDGSRSTDFDGIVNRFSWNFGDGREGGGERPVHVYGEPGTYRVALTIWGDEGGSCDSSHTDEMTVQVRPATVVAIDAPATAAAGGPVVLVAKGEADGDAAAAGARWDFGDGQTGQGARIEHVYRKPGSYLVNLTLAADGAATACRASTAKQAILVNAAPLAVAGENRQAAPGEELVFDAAASSDPDGAITSYRWAFGDGETATGVQARHRYRQPGRHQVTLTVDDGAGLANSQAADVLDVLVNAPPLPKIDAPEAACVGDMVAFSGERSADPDGRIARYDWQLGDGAEVEAATAARVFGRPGHYDVGLLVDDGSGVANSAAQAVARLHVNQPPRAAAGPDRIACPGMALAFDAGGSYDPDGSLTRWIWDFGDGTTAEGASASHSYARPGEYHVHLSVSDDSGSRCATAGDTARVVVDGPPVARAAGDRAGWVGGAHDEMAFDAGRSSDPDGTPLSYVWDLGDGQTATGETVRHGYLNPGAYRVRLTVDDGSGLPCGQSADELAVQIRPRAR